MSVTSHEQIQVLHVDDEPSIADLTATFLERESDRFTVKTATSADEGLERISDRPPDCVVSDYNMPGTNGIEFLQAVREKHPDLPFILFTGEGSEAVASEAIAADVTSYLQKGSGSEQYELLANRIRNAVQARREAKRADRQEQLMRLTEFAGDTGGFELDRESGAILLTAGTRRIISRPDQTEIDINEVTELFHSDDHENIRQALDKTLQAGDELHDTWRLQPGDGDERLLDITVTPVAENGEVTKLRGVGHDITDREQRQRELEQIETLFQHAQDSLFLVDVGDEHTIERVNPAWEDATGLSAKQVRGRTPRDVLGKQPGAAAEAKYRECIQRQEPLQYEETARFDGGITHWVTQIAPVVVDGSVEYIAGSTRDVTEQKERQQDLEEHETVIEALIDAVYVLDEEGRFSYINNEFVELVGYDRETVLGSTPSLIKDEEAVEQAEHQLGRLLSSDGPETTTFEVTVHPREGEPIVCEDHMGVLPYDGDEFDGSVGTLRDITDRKERERELAQSRDLMANMEELANVGAWEYDPGSDTLMVTDGARRIRGLDPGADLALEEAFDGFHPDDRDLLADRFDECLETGEPYEIDVRLTTLGGEQRWATVRGERVEGRDGDVIRGYIRDITEQKEYEQELNTQNERLEEFASVVSHDLRNPLNVVGLSLEMARENGNPEAFDRAERAVERMNDLIEDLLTLAREGNQVDETESVALTDVARDSWQSVETAQTTLKADALRAVEADRSRLRQLFENLYRNAAEHGGDDITVSVGVMDDGFYVADTGPGIPESEREAVFEAGYSTTEDGTGFGLRIVEQIAEAHGWEITVTESEQGGARFDVTGINFTDG